MRKTLIYGYGNPGRQDDALGVLCATEIEKWAERENLDWLKVECSYQLNVEDAATISEFDQVIFVDASLEELDTLKMTEVLPNEAKIEFSMHALSPAYVLYLCRQIFNCSPKTYLLHIKGHEWDFVEGLSENAKSNLALAVNKIKQQLIATV
jgi:hydrogenase maturation protease